MIWHTFSSVNKSIYTFDYKYMGLKSIEEIIMESMDFYWSISNKISMKISMSFKNPLHCGNVHLRSIKHEATCFCLDIC